MSQTIFDFIDPAISGTTLATTLDNFKNAIVSGLSGTSRPTELDPGGYWVDTTNNPNSWSFKIWTGSADVEIFSLDLVTGIGSVALAVDSFQVKKVSADTVGAVMELVKRRIATNGQVLSGDVVGEIRMVGRTDTSTNPVVAKIIFTATDNQTTSAYGGTLSFWSTPDGTATLTEHMKFIDGVVETIVPHKLNSQILVSQDIATTATIAQLSAAKVVVEMTGSTATDIQGINSAHASKVVYIHNRSSAAVTLKHLNGSAAAADRIKLPTGTDFAISSDTTVALYYCTTETYWKLLSTSERAGGSTTDTLYGATQTWTSPASVTNIKVTAYKYRKGGPTEQSGFLDVFGNAYAWGANANGQLGLGDVTPRSSPVAVLAGLLFDRKYGSTANGVMSYGLSAGNAYAWGVNTNGQLGLSDVVPRSSPVAVTGGFKFSNLYPRDSSVIGLTMNGIAYAWGINTNGQLGLGDVTPRSAPTAVLRGLKFAKIVATTGANGSSAILGVDKTGAMYAWGLNTNGNLGLGDVTPRSSPVAVLGGLTIAQIGGGAVSSRYFNVALNTSGAAYAWGANTNSNLGVGDQTPRSSPVAVLGGLTFNRLITHDKSETVMAMTSAGALYAWGDNTSGVLGVGDIVNRSSPVAVLGGLTFKEVFLFKSTAFGMTSDGTLYAWGANANGQLGVGDVVARSSPVAVLGSLKFAHVYMADGPSDTYSIFGITPDGLTYSWGVNANGTLGLGDVTPRSSPVVVLGAFGPDGRDTVSYFDFSIAASTAYTVSMGSGVSAFGNKHLGHDIFKVEISYVS